MTVVPEGDRPTPLRSAYRRSGFITSLRVAADGAAPFAPQAPSTLQMV